MELSSSSSASDRLADSLGKGHDMILHHSKRKCIIEYEGKREKKERLFCHFFYFQFLQNISMNSTTAPALDVTDVIRNFYHRRSKFGWMVINSWCRVEGHKEILLLRVIIVITLSACGTRIHNIFTKPRTAEDDPEVYGSIVFIVCFAPKKVGFTTYLSIPFEDVNSVKSVFFFPNFRSHFTTRSQDLQNWTLYS